MFDFCLRFLSFLSYAFPWWVYLPETAAFTCWTCGSRAVWIFQSYVIKLWYKTRDGFGIRCSDLLAGKARKIAGKIPCLPFNNSGLRGCQKQFKRLSTNFVIGNDETENLSSLLYLQSAVCFLYTACFTLVTGAVVKLAPLYFIRFLANAMQKAIFIHINLYNILSFEEPCFPCCFWH